MTGLCHEPFTGVAVTVRCRRYISRRVAWGPRPRSAKLPRAPPKGYGTSLAINRFWSFDSAAGRCSLRECSQLQLFGAAPCSLDTYSGDVSLKPSCDLWRRCVQCFQEINVESLKSQVRPLPLRTQTTVGTCAHRRQHKSTSNLALAIGHH